MFHMGEYLKSGFGVQGSGAHWSGVIDTEGMKPGIDVDMARSLERALRARGLIRDGNEHTLSRDNLLAF